MRLANNSVSVVIRSFALAAAREDGQNVIVWLEIAPQHPKAVGAIWASLVNGTKETLSIRTDDNKGIYARGLNRRYHRLTMDAPRMAGRARPVFLRLAAPEALAIQRRSENFIALEWPGRTIGVTLAAMLEEGTPYPVQIGWGDYLLRAAVKRGDATWLVTGGPAPQGYLISGQTPWGEIITEGLKQGYINLHGEANLAAMPALPLIESADVVDEIALDTDGEEAWKREAIARDIAATPALALRASAGASVARSFGGPVEVVGADPVMQGRIRQLLK